MPSKRHFTEVVDGRVYVPKRNNQKDTLVRGFSSFYADYKKLKRKESIWEVNLTRKQYYDFFYKLFRLIADKIINDAFIFYMPYGLGNIRVNKTNRKLPKTGLTNDRSYRKSWNKLFEIVWDTQFAYIKDKDAKFFKPALRVKKMKYDKIDRANEDPMEKDLMGYNNNASKKRTNDAYVWEHLKQKKRTNTRFVTPSEMIALKKASE